MIEFFRINSKSLSRNPSSITYAQSKIQNSDRTLDGTLAVDIIAIKQVLNVEWKVLSKEDMTKLMTEIEDSKFVTISYINSSESQGLKSIIALPGNVTYTPYYNFSTDSIVWKDVKISFTEK